MRTTIDLSDELFRRAKMEAASRGISFKSLVEQSVRWTLQSKKNSQPKRKRVKLPLFGSKKLGKLNIPDDVAYRSQRAEDMERYAASTRR
jgi:hypothetical protein